MAVVAAEERTTARPRTRSKTDQRGNRRKHPLNSHRQIANHQTRKLKNIKVKEGDTIQCFGQTIRSGTKQVVQAEDYKSGKTTKICYSEDGVEEEIDIRNEESIEI